MKCPKCNTKNTPASNATCSQCKYVFVLNPREPPYISDRAVNRAVGAASENGRYRFTMNQLYAAVYRIAAKQARSKRRVYLFVLLSALAYMAFCLLVGPSAGTLAVTAVLVVVLVWFIKRETNVPGEGIMSVISAYHNTYPIEGLVDGTYFKKKTSRDELKKELFDYAPERILIVQRDDVVDMLALNGFHLENKTAVLSASKYPKHLFDACQRFLEKHPNIPVEIVHDASKEGLQLKAKLVEDPSWNLAGKDVKDLGMFVDDVKRMKRPPWMPAPAVGAGAGQRADDSDAKTVEQKMERGGGVAVDSVPTKALLAGLAAAAIAALPLMAAAMGEEEAQRKKDFGDSFG
jgi:hypothetical protein